MDRVFARISRKGKKFCFSLCRIQEKKKKTLKLEAIVLNRGVKIISHLFS